MLLNLFLLLFGFVLLICGADYLVRATVSLAQTLHISPRIIGMTMVAFGTSAPELVVNLSAAITGHQAIIFGNVIGSNIFNVLLISGSAALVLPTIVKKESIRYEIPLCVFSAVLVAVLALFNFSQTKQYIYISRIDGMLLLICFVLFLLYTIGSSKKDVQENVKKIEYGVFVSIIIFLISLTALVFGGKLVVDKAVFIAHYFNISERVIAIMLVSIGTSLPELAVSLVAAIKKHNDIAIGNIIGSNIFNVFFILGISTIISPIKITEGVFDIAIHVLSVTLLLFCVMFSKKQVLDDGSYIKKIGRRSGSLLLLTLIFYIWITISM